jgi:CIC family chloride channel protein
MPSEGSAESESSASSSRAGRPAHHTHQHDHLGDFTATPRLLAISALAVVVGGVAAYVSYGLLALIGFFTNLFFFQRVGTSLVSPAGHHLGPWVIAIPVAGGLVIGLMARYGSDRIRGHGIPEAIEAILMNGSRVEPKVALLKPISAAISIGSGGPFGAEGPIILTGGAFGSLVAQFFHLTSTERKTLLVAGAAAGMAATFAAPLASTLLAVELLLFELKPRSLVPVALASIVATTIRRHLMGMGPIFPVPVHPAFVGYEGLLGCAFVGLLAGGFSALLTGAVYAAEDAFQRLPIHWMWWPALGGLVIGVGGWIFPQALGVGYDVIATLLTGDAPLTIVLGVLIVKSLIWSISLGSGTSGGVLAPLLMMGAAVGAIASRVLPFEGGGFWPLVGMSAILGGTMRVPLTSVVFAYELTHDGNVLLPLMLAVVVAHTFTVLVMRRSILTEKISRRGYHVSREYSIDPLEIIFAREVVRRSVVALPADATADQVDASMRSGPTGRNQQRLFPVVQADRTVVGVITRGDLRRWIESSRSAGTAPLREIIERRPVMTFEDEPLRVVVAKMAGKGVTRLPVVERGTRRFVGMIALADLLTARVRLLEAEERRERVLGRQFRLPAAFERLEKLLRS